MLYFIPAWYKQNMWCENEQQWYKRRLKSEFDETIKQITLFHRNVDRPYRILVLGYSPNFRHFLHRQGMYRSKYWSCFDAIAQVRRKKVAVLSYHDIKWPKGLEFVYSPFSIIALQGDVKYAQVEFSEDGNPISIDMFEDGKICRRNYYDDRGFVSSTVIYENGIEQYQDFLMENGIWKIREYKNNGHVIVNQTCPDYDVVPDAKSGKAGEPVEMRFLSEASDAEYYAQKVDSTGGVYFVPAFTGLGAPYWDMYARGAIVGITRGTKREHIIRAAQESIAYQSMDLVAAMEKDTGVPLRELRVDGGASRDAFLMQFQADMLATPVRRPVIRETTALGAAYLAGLAVGIWHDPDELRRQWRCDVSFLPHMTAEQREKNRRGWAKAVGRSLDWAKEE